jgi:ubiquitin C-terminal hydrolase
MKGLTNFGNTCYFNAALQCLIQVPQLSNYMILLNIQGDQIFNEYVKLVRSFWITKGRVDTLPLMKAFVSKYKQFDNNNQNDCQEAFMCLFDSLEKYCEPFMKKVFYSEMISNKELVYNHMMSDSFDLQKYDKFKDPSPIVVFSFPTYERKTKILLNDVIRINDFIYELFATAVHTGSVSSGHYIAYTKHKGQWFIKNDTISSPIKKIPMNDYHYIALFKRLPPE